MARFREPDRSQVIEWRGCLDDLLPPGHLARFIWDKLSSIDFNELEAQYPAVQGGPGRPPYHPRMITALWIYGMTQGMETASAIAEACMLRNDFRWLTGGLNPCDQTLLNLLTRALETLTSVWVQVLQAMHKAGLIDLELIIEDGTKLITNASARSFRTLERITKLLEQLHARLAERLAELASYPEPLTRKVVSELTGLRGRLTRAELAKAEVQERLRRRQARAPQERAEEGAAPSSPPPPTFTNAHFKLHPDRDVLICPADQELRFVGEYPISPGSQTSYRLYKRSDCTGCSLKTKCTRAKARRVKLRSATPQGDSPPAATDDTQKGTVSRKKGAEKEKPVEPTASTTEPEAVWMKATARKRWEPCFNADISVTPDGIIVSQFLTTDSTDYHHFEPALDFVRSTLGTPDRWIGDGHYSTAANLELADRHSVLLYAPRRSSEANESDSEAASTTVSPDSCNEADSTNNEPTPAPSLWRANHFQYDKNRDVLVCPADEDLRFIGEYPNDSSRGGTYRLYGRRNCTACQLKENCTNGRGRRVRRQVRGDHSGARGPPSDSGATPSNSSPQTAAPANLPKLIEELNQRMESEGVNYMQLRRQTVEPTNAHLKQHGLGRFHVRGLPRCANVQTLASIAHNLMKWSARQATLAMGLV